ncbi:MAG TPA: hypothetical protein VFO01_18335 [Trebonia sp.]|nr:hypothetical protein [Trebonia sp.]
MAPGDAGSWDDGSLGYRDDGYPADGGGYGYGPDDGYPGQGQPGYGPQEGQYGDPYGQPPYGGYGPGQGQGGYGGPQGYGNDDYGYDQPADYDYQPAPGYGTGGYQGQNPGYGQSGSYPEASALDGYSAPGYGSGAYPVPPGGSGAYPVPPGSSGAYPAADAGNDWYGGQPAAAKGASFADTGSYALNGRVIDEYGTGPRRAMRDPVRGYPSGPGQQGSGPLPVPARSALPSPPQSVAETRQQERLDDPATQLGRVPGGGFRGAPGGGLPRAATGGFQLAPAPGAVGGRGGYNDSPDDSEEPGAADDPYQDRADGPDGSRPARGGGRGPGRAKGGRPARSPLGGKRLLFASLGVVAFGIIAVAAYVFLFKPGSPSSAATATGPLPTASAQPSAQACVKQLGTYCHIETAADDPKPLTVAELYKPAFTNEKDKISYSLVSTKLDTKCADAVIGQNLIKALQAGKCTQVVRASYVSGDGKIMGTIGVVNLTTTTEAHDAGKVVGKNDFIAPLTSAKGVASKLGNGTGVVEAEFKGHYLLLTWSEYVNGTTPTTKAQDAQLEQFSSDLVAGTANIALTQRMVNGAPASAGVSS